MKYLVTYSTIDSGVALRSLDASSALEAVKKDYQPPVEKDRQWWDNFCDEATGHEITVHDLTGREHKATSFFHPGSAERWCAAIEICEDENLTVFCSGRFMTDDEAWHITAMILPDMQLNCVASIEAGAVRETAQTLQ